MVDTYYADQMCYITSTGSINRDHAVCYGILNAVRLLTRAYLYQYDPQMKLEREAMRAATTAGKTIADPDFPTFPWLLRRSSEWTLDSFLIGTFFEVVAKAFVLNEGYLVHKADSGRAVPTTIKALANAQKEVPIPIRAYAPLDPFADYRSVGRNGMKYLKHETIGYSWVYENGYRDLLPFSDDFIALAREYRLTRNLSHFPLVGASESIVDQTPLERDHVDVINAEIIATIRPLFERLTTSHSFNLTLPL